MSLNLLIMTLWTKGWKTQPKFANELNNQERSLISGMAGRRAQTTTTACMVHTECWALFSAFHVTCLTTFWVSIVMIPALH